MPLKQRIAVHGGTRRSSQTGKIVCIALICVLAIGLGALSVYTVMAHNAHSRTAAQQAAALAQVRSELAQVKSDSEKAQTEASAALTEKDEKIAQQEGKITEQETKIGEQEKTIQDLNDRIKDLEQQVALKHQEQAQVQGQPNGKYPNQKIVALTFDDGPGPYTAELLDILKARGVPATFFVLGSRVDAYPDLIRRIAAEGHELGNHSNGHNDLGKMTTLEQVRAEMDACANKINKLIGKNPTVMRCPYGSYSNLVKQYAQSAGIPITHWDVDTLDWKSRNVTAILNQTFGSNGLGDGSILLLHDIHKTSVEAVPQLIDRLKAQGYTFVTVTELLQARCGVQPGKVYYEG